MNFFELYLAVFLANLTVQIIVLCMSTWYFSGPFWKWLDSDEDDA